MLVRNVLIAGAVALALASATAGVQAIWGAVAGAPPRLDQLSQQTTPPPATVEPERDSREAVEFYAMVLAVAHACPNWRVNDGAVALMFLKAGVTIADMRPGGRFNALFETGGAQIAAAASAKRGLVCLSASTKLGPEGWLIEQ